MINFGLGEKTVLLTGPNTAVGRAIAYRLSELGANITIVDKNEERTQRLASEIMDQREVKEGRGRAAAIITDVTKLHHAKDVVRRAAEFFGGIDIYIDGLMLSQDQPIHSPTAVEELERVVDVNLKAPFFMTHESLQFLRSRRRARIIYLIPELACYGWEGESLASATRTGLVNLAKTVARESNMNQLTVNCVSVGPTEDYLLARNPNLKSAKEALEKLRAKNGYADLVDPNDVANVIAFLASGLANAINGQTIRTGNGFN